MPIPLRNGRPKENRIAPVAFSRFKYGREVCVDARPISAWTGVAPGIVTHRLDFHELLVVERGRGTVWTDDERCVVAGPTVILTAPGQVRRVDVEQPFDGRLVVFTQDAGERIRVSGLRLAADRIGVFSSLPTNMLARVANVTDAMQCELNERYPDMSAMLEALLAQLVILLGRVDSHPLSVPREPPLLSRLRQLVDEQFRFEHAASTYARALGVSLDHLSAIARQHGHRSVKTIIQARIHEEARRLLLHTDMTVAEIGFALGYDEPSHFARAFRLAVGFAPSRFRLQTSEKYR